MMSNKQAASFRDPVVLGNIPRLQRPVEDVVLPGYSSSPSLPRYSQEEPTNYSGSYFSMCLSGQEGGDLSAHWSSTRTCLQSDRSPVLHPSSSDGPLPNHILYRPDHMAIPVEKSPALDQNQLAAKQKASFYDGASETRGPMVTGVHTPVAVRKISMGGTGVTSQSESTIGLAIPKPIYGHSTCCGELGYSSGSSYGSEPETARIHPTICDEDWVLQYGHLPLSQSSRREALMQGRVLELDHGQRLPLKDTQTESYLAVRPSRSLRMPAFVDPGFSGFSYGGTSHSVLSRSREQCHGLQFPSKMYHGLPSSPSCTFEDMPLTTLSYSNVPSKLYPDHSTAAPGQTQSPPHPAFYYPRGRSEVSSNAAYSDMSTNHRQDVSGCINKHDAQNPSGRYRIPHPVFGDIPSSCPITPRTHSFLSSYDGSPYQLYKMHPVVGRKRTYSEGPGPILSVPLPGRSQDYSSLRAKLLPSPSRLCGQGFGSGAFHPVQPRFEHRNGQESVVRCSILDNRLTSPKEVDTTVKASVNNDSNLHASVCTRELMSNQPGNTNDLVTGELSVLKRKENCDKFVEAEIPRRAENEESTERWKGKPEFPPSPPMPIINNVFSLAPYKAYLEATGMLPAPTTSDHSEPASDGSNLKSGTQSHQSVQQTSDEPVDRLISTGDSLSSQEKDFVKTKALQQIKTEQSEEEASSESSDQTNCDSEHLKLKEMGFRKEEASALTGPPDSVLDLSVKKSESHEASCKILTLSGGSEYQNPSEVQSAVLEDSGNDKAMTPPLKFSDTQLRFQHIPPQYLKLSAFKITVPSMLRNPCENTSDSSLCLLRSKPSTEPPLDPVSAQDSSRRARHHFMELHQSLCTLISSSVARSPEQELRVWLDSTGPGPPSPSCTKVQSISGLLGTAVRDVWLRCMDTAAVFQQVMGQLESFVASRKCPFPHVVRAGALFIPMVVVKESLFPQVPGAFIDQVLQERRVELRPTTLSEERHLAQLQKRACSSKLRRLLSLKHLPDVYPDVMNLFYHTCVSKHLGQEQRVQVVKSDIGSCSQSRACKTACSPKRMKNTTSLKKQKRKGRRKSDAKRLFFGEKVPDMSDTEHIESSENWSIISSFSENTESSNSAFKYDVQSIKIKVEDSSDLEQIATEEPDKVWGPVMSDEVSSGDSDTEAERVSTGSRFCQSSGSAKLPGSSRSHSGMILKLRKVFFNKGPNRHDSDQHVLDTEVHKGRKEVANEEEDRALYLRMRPTGHHIEGGSISETPRHIGSPSKSTQLRRCVKALHPRHPPLQVKYCSYLSASRNGRHCRWVLRSAMRTAHRAMKNRYPELVGKRICHLYEEKDKTEVWYKGLVVGIHEPHPNPLKTVFEVKYDSEPEWQYYLELLMDYKKGWLKVED